MAFKFHDFTVEKWLVPLPIPAAATPSVMTGYWQYTIPINPVLHDFHPKLTNIPMWTYGQYSPGAIIDVPVNQAARITWENNLGKDVLGTVLDLGIRQGMEEDHMLQKAHNQVHVHGARVPWTSDGAPMQVFHPREARTYYYPNNQAASTLWYHDHAMDVTRLNVYAGLFGGYIIRDPDEANTLPAGELEVPLILQDKSFNELGTKLYYEQTITCDKNSDLPVLQPEFEGDYPVVNGKIWPFFAARPRIYRFRLFNGANTRVFNLSFKNYADGGAVKQLEFYVIGMEGGFLETPAPTRSLLLAPGERADILLDLREENNRRIILSNDAELPFKNGVGGAKAEFLELLRIDVSGTPDADDTRFDPALDAFKLPVRIDPLKPREDKAPRPDIPLSKDDFKRIDALIDQVNIDKLTFNLKLNGTPIKLRRFVLEEYAFVMPTLKGQNFTCKDGSILSWKKLLSPTVLINKKSWKAAKPVSVAEDSLEIWEFINLTTDVHPMHIHLVNFKVVSRRALNVIADPSRKPTPALKTPQCATGYIKAADRPPPFEQGWKDTVRCNPKEATRLLMRFDGFSGEYVFHCHILEHEDMGMMLPLNVEPRK